MSQFIRFTGLEPEYLTCEQIKPVVLKAMQQYEKRLKADYGNALLTPEEAADYSLANHKVVLIDDQYLFGYVIGNAFFSKAQVMQEEFLIRVNHGKARLPDVLTVIRLLKRLHKVRHCYIGTRAAANQQAINRLYQRYGVTPLMQIMRF